MKPIEHLDRAADLLGGGKRVNAMKLCEAAGHFWSASFDEEHWPLSLRVSSTSLKAKLLAQGTISETVQSLDEDRRGGLATELARFCGEARQWFGGDLRANLGPEHRLLDVDCLPQTPAEPRSSPARDEKTSPIL